MTFLSIKGNTINDPYILSEDKRIILSLAGFNSIILTEFDEDGLSVSIGGFNAVNGRTPKGYLITKGVGYRPTPEFRILSCIVTESMKNTLELMKASQDSNGVAITLQNRFNYYPYDAATMRLPTWLSGYPIVKDDISLGFTAWSVWLDFDQDWCKLVTHDWYQITFDAQILDI